MITSSQTKVDLKSIVETLDRRIYELEGGDAFEPKGKPDPSPTDLREEMTHLVALRRQTVTLL